MKTLLAVLLFAVSTVAVAEDKSYMVKYNSNIHGLILYSGTSNDTSKWEKNVYLLDSNNKVILRDVDPTIVKVLGDLKR